MVADVPPCTTTPLALAGLRGLENRRYGDLSGVETARPRLSLIASRHTA